MNRTVRTITAAAILAVVVLALTPTLASAHIPNAQATCTALTIDVHGYEQWKTNPAPPYNNELWLTIDGTTQHHYFEHQWHDIRNWDPTVAHSWQVVIDANLHQGDPTRWDVPAGALDGTTQPCVEDTTTTESATTSSTPEAATTTVVTPTTTIAAVSGPTTTIVDQSVPRLPVTGTDTTLIAVAIILTATGWTLHHLHKNRATS